MLPIAAKINLPVQTKINSIQGEQILIEIYRRMDFDKQTITSIYNTNSSIRNYIDNSEKEKLRKEHITAKTIIVAGISETVQQELITVLSTAQDSWINRSELSPTLRDKLLDLSPSFKNNETFITALLGNPANRPNISRLNATQIYHFLRLVIMPESERKLSTLYQAGILCLDSDEFQNICSSKGILSEHDENEVDNKVYASILSGSEPLQKQIADNFIENIKKDTFLYPWLLYGFLHYNEEYHPLASVLNFKYSNLSNLSFDGIHFETTNLKGSCLDGSSFYKCHFEDAWLEDVTMYGARIDDCNGYTNNDFYTVQALIDGGVKGLNLDDYAD